MRYSKTWDAGCKIPVLSMDTITDSMNVAEHFDEDYRAALGRAAVEGFDKDRISRAEWEDRMEKASKIALQVKEAKTFPWPDASNVKFPLLTIAALQYHSRMYPALLDMPTLVQCTATGADPQGEKAKSGKRIGEHMSWQLCEEDEAWEDEMDRTLFVQALMGSCFKKSYRHDGKGHNVSECVLPQDFVVSYYTKDLATCPRATHVLTWYHNDLQERILTGKIFDTALEAPTSAPAEFGKLDAARDEAQGVTRVVDDPDAPFTILEQYIYLDLDGDGLKEPYTVWVRYDTRQLLRVLPRFLPSGLKYETIRGEKTLVRIEAEQYFTKYGLIPSPDGGFYDLGFGSLLGPLNESIDTSINQLFDAGTMSNAGGGFLGRGARIKGGAVTFKPNEWKRVDSTGDDLRKSIVELPRREPSAVLFQLVGLLIEYGQRVAGAPDIVQGQNPGQNTPAETSRNMMEQGIKAFSGIYKRTYRSLKQEFRKLYRLNQLYLEDEQGFVDSNGFETKVLLEDYKAPVSAVRPAATSYYLSDGQRIQQAIAIREASMSAPGYDLREVNLYYLEAWKVPNPERFLPDPNGPRAIQQGPSEKVQIEQLKQQGKGQEIMLNMKMKLFELMEEHRVNEAKILQLQADAVAKMASVDDADVGHELQAMQNAISLAKVSQEGRLKGMEVLRDIIDTMKGVRNGSNDEGGVPNMDGARVNAALDSLAKAPAAAPAGPMEEGNLPLGGGQ